MMRENKNGGYLVTGSWAKKAAKEASFMGSSTIIASSEDKTSITYQKLHYRFKPRLFSLYIKQYNFWNSS